MCHPLPKVKLRYDPAINIVDVRRAADYYCPRWWNSLTCQLKLNQSTQVERGVQPTYATPKFIGEVAAELKCL